MRPSRARLLVVALVSSTTAGLAASCREPTQVTLVLSTDLPCSDLSGTTIAVGLESEIEGRPASAETTACDASGRIGTMVVVPSADAEGSFAIRVVAGKGMSASDCVTPDWGPPPPSDVGCIVARRALRFISHASLTLPIDLRASCVGKPCSPGQTCVKGTCLSADVDVEKCQDEDGCGEESLPPPSGGPDAGVDDAGDAGPDAPACSESPCKIVAPQCGCALGQACVHVGKDQRGCAPAGDGVQGAPCDDSTMACAPGYACEGLQDTSTPLCKKYCESDADCEGPIGKCALDLKVTGLDLGFSVCSDVCDPIANTGCPASTACRLAGNAAGVVFVVCLEAGRGTHGAPCTTLSDCAPGHHCANGTCHQVCDVAVTPSTCPGAVSCAAVKLGMSDVVIGSTQYGLCP